MDQEPTVIQSKMNKPLLILGPYSYRIHVRKSDTIRWACSKDRQTRCKARLVTDSGNCVISTGRVEHSCVPDPAEIEVKKTYEMCRKRVREETSVPVKIIFKEEFSKICSDGLQYLTKVPKYGDVKGTLCKERRRVLGTKQNPKDPSEAKSKKTVEFPQSLPELPNVLPTIDQEPTVIQSKMNKPLLILGPYSYRVHVRKSDTIRWACSKDRQTGCKARLVTDSENCVISTGRVEHSCIRDPAEIEVKKTYEMCRKRVREETSVPVNIIFKEEFSKIYSDGLQYLTKVPKYEDVKATLCRDRRKALGTEQTPKDPSAAKSKKTVEFPQSLPDLPNVDQEPSVINSKMKKPLLILGPYTYRIHLRKDDTIGWVCRKDRQTGCKARLVTDLENCVISQGRVGHSCVPDLAEIEVEKTYERCRKRVREETSVPVNIIFKEEFSKIYSDGLHLLTKVPKYEDVKGTLCKERRQVLKEESIPKDPVSLEFPKSLLELPNGEHFLIADRVISTGRICIFAGVDGKELMSSGSICFFDGTRKCCPKQFKQVYTIHVDVGSTEYESNVCPAIFALLPDKEESTYRIMLEMVKEWCPSWSPELIKVDFENSMMTAIKSIFPQTQLSGCSLHFGQCLWRQIQTLDLVKDYRGDEAVKQTCNKCAALAYLPPACIQEAWMLILQSAPENEKLDKFLAYFVDQWLENREIPPDVWNVYSQRHQIDNAVEDWNRKLYSLFGMENPNIFFFIEKLKLFVGASFMIEGRESGESTSRRKTTYVKLDEKIQPILENFGRTQDLGRCLQALSQVCRLE